MDAVIIITHFPEEISAIRCVHLFPLMILPFIIIGQQTFNAITQCCPIWWTGPTHKLLYVWNCSIHYARIYVIARIKDMRQKLRAKVTGLSDGQDSMIAPMLTTCPDLLQEWYHKMLIPQVKILCLPTQYHLKPVFYFYPISRGGTTRPTWLAFVPATDIHLFVLPLGIRPITVIRSQLPTCRAEHWKYTAARVRTI